MQNKILFHRFFKVTYAPWGNLFKLSYTPLKRAISMNLIAFFVSIPSTQAAEVYINGPEETYLPGLFNATDETYIGNATNGSLLINNGNLAEAKDLYVGSGFGGNGVLTLTGMGTSLSILNMIHNDFDPADPNDIINISNTLLGAQGSGTLNVIDGALFSFGNLTIDGLNGHSGNLLISGQGSSATEINAALGHVNYSLSTVIGEAGIGILTLSDGGTMKGVSSLTLGKQAGSLGTLSISGGDADGHMSSLNYGISGEANLTLGSAGAGVFTMTSGGTFEATSSYNTNVTLGAQSSGSGTLSISGTNTVFDGTAQFGGGGIFIIGDAGIGALTISDGGTIRGANSMTLGKQVGSSGTLIISGTDAVGNSSLFDYAGFSGAGLIVGDSGIGVLKLASGGIFKADPIYYDTNVTLGAQSTGNGTLTISGTNTVFDGTTNYGGGGYYIIGDAGRGILTISNGGTLKGVNNLTLGNQVSGNGTLVIGALPGDTAASPGNLSFGNLNIGSGEGHLVFNHTDDNYLFAHNMTIASGGTLGLSVLNGNTTLTTNAWGGDTTLSGGKLILGNADSLGSGNVTFDGGTLDLGTGTASHSVQSLTLKAGTLRTDFTGITASNPNMSNLFNNGDTYKRNELIAGSFINGTPASVSLEDNSGSPSIDSTGILEDNGGNKVGTGTWGVKLGLSQRLSEQGNILGLTYGLQSAVLDAGKMLSLNLVDSGANAATFDSVLSGQGGVTLDATSGTINFGHIGNAYDGATDLIAGTLNLTTDSALGNTSGLILASDSAVNLQGHIQTLGTLTTGAGSELTLGGGSLTLGGGQVDGNLSGAGFMTFNRGNSIIGSDNNGLSASVSIDQPATVVLTQRNGLGTGSILLNGELALGGNTPQTLDNVLSGTGALLNTGNWTLDHDNAFSGGTTVNAGNLTLLTDGAAGTGAIVNNATLTLDGTADLTLDNALSGTGQLTKTGAGSWTLGHDNTYGGGTTISNGNLTLLTAGAAGTGGIANNATLTLSGISGTLANALTGSGQLNLTGANVSLIGLSGFAGALDVAADSTLMSDDAGLSNLSSGTVNGTLAVSGAAGQNLTLDRTLTGGGTLALTAGDAASGYALSGLDNFGGTVSLTRGVYTLDAAGSAMLDNATLVTGQGNVLTLATRNAGALGLGGGTLDLAGNPPVTVRSMDMASGTLKADLSSVGQGQINTTNLFTSADGVIRTLVHAVENLTGSATNLSLADSNGASLTPLVATLNDAGGEAVGTAAWGLKLGQQANDLNLAWGLQSVNVNGGKTLALNLADSGAQAAMFDAVLTGQGGLSLDATGGAITLGNAANAYTGATALSGGTLSLATRNALGNTSGLSMAASTTLNLQGNSLNLGILSADGGSQITLGGGSLTLTNGGRVDGNLAGSGALVFTGGNAVISSDNPGLTAGVRIAQPATVTLTQAGGLGTGGVLLDGILALKDVTGTLVNNLSGAGTLTIDPTDVTLSGDNSNFTGTLTIADADSVLRVSEAKNLGQATVSDAGTLVINTADSWTLGNLVTGSGNFTKAGNGVLTTGDSLQTTGLTTVSGGTLVLSQGSGTAGALSVNAGGTLASGGDVTAPVTLDGMLSALNAVAGYTGRDNANLTLSGALNNRGLINLASGSGTPGNTLTLTGAVTSSGGAIRLATLMGDDASATDRVILHGAAVNGTTGLIIHRAGGVGAQTLQGIEVVSAEGGSTTAADSFALDSRSDGYRSGTGNLAVGAYDYSLTRGGKGGDANSWYLNSLRSFRPETGAYLMNREVTQDLMAVPLGAGLRSSEDTGFWVQAGGNAIAHDEAGSQRVSARTRTLNLGTDLLEAQLSQGYARAGVMLGTGSATTWSHAADGASARGTVNGMSGGVYGRWSTEKEAQTGASLQSSLQYGSFSNSVKGDGLGRESYRTTVTQAGLRGEYGIKVYESGENSITLTPMLGLTGSHYRMPDFTEHSTDSRVSGGDRNAITTEVGMRFQGSLAADNARLRPYLETRWLRDSAGNGLSLDGTQINSKAPRSRVAATAGLDALLTPALSASVGVNGETGAAGYRALGVLAGIKYHF